LKTGLSNIILPINENNNKNNENTDPDKDNISKSSIPNHKDKIDEFTTGYESLIKIRHEDIKRILNLLPVSVLTDNIKLLFAQSKPSRLSSGLSIIINLLFLIVLS